MNSARLCLACKGGRALCGNRSCPLLPRFSVKKQLEGRLSKEFFGPSLSLFVGRMGYPDVNVGPMVALEERPGMDDPRAWLGMDYGSIVELRSLLMRSKQRENVRSGSRLVLESQELVLADRPTDVEMRFKKLPAYRVSFSDVMQPMGPSAPLERLRLAENPHIPRRVDRIVSDDMKASQASYELYRSGEDVHRLSAILSSGVLGMKENRKMVPTRWSITALDDMIAKALMMEIRELPSINEFLVFESQHLDNHFVILMMPGGWEFENFEAWAPGSLWASGMKKAEIVAEYEPFSGRTMYAELEGGGYYASRLGVVEGLHAMGRQARVAVFREVYEGYTVPLGVWQVRQNVRNAMSGKPIKFSSPAEALAYAGSRLTLPVSEYLRQSRMLRQRRLSDFGQI